MRDNVATGPRQGSPSQDASGFPIAIAGGDLQFRTFALADPVPTGRQIIEAFTLRDPTGPARTTLALFMTAADSFDAKHATPAAARRQLEREGIITKSGRLTKRFSD